MNIEEVRDFCLGFPGVTESFPFDETTLVFKVMGKMFCMLSLEGNHALNLKNRPEKIIELREQYSAVLPGYHMNKNHWMVVALDAGLAGSQVRQWISESYGLVVQGLTGKMKEELKKLEQ